MADNKLSDDWKAEFRDWLVNNLQVTKEGTNEIIISHVSHYFINPLQRELKIKENIITEQQEAIKILSDELMAKFETEDEK